MNRWEHEITAPIRLDELQRLLNAMMPAQPPVSIPRARTKADIPRFFDGVDWDELLASTMARMITPTKPRPVPPPFPRKITESSRANRTHAEVAAALPRCGQTRAPRLTRPSLPARARTQSRSLAVAERKAPRTVAELRARLDSGETAAQWDAACVLSPRVLAHLSAEELAMIPAEIRGEPPPEFPDEDPPIRIELAPVPCAEVVDLPWAPVPAEELELDLQPRRFAAFMASVASVILLVLCAAYFLS